MNLGEFLERKFDAPLFEPKVDADRDVEENLRTTSEIPFGIDAYVNDHTLNTLDGTKLQIIKVEGLYAEMLNDDDIDNYKLRRDTALQSISSPDLGIYVHEIRRESDEWPSGSYKNWFPNYLNERLKGRHQQKDRKLYRHDIYITLCRYRHMSGAVGAIGKVLGKLSSSMGGMDSDRRQLRDLDEKVASIMKSLRVYGPRRLSRVTTERGTFCEMARFLRYLINLEDGPVRADAYHLGRALSTAYLSFDKNVVLGRDVFEVKGINHWRIGQVMAMSQWPSGTFAGMADPFQKVKAEVIVTQKFFPVNKLDTNRDSAMRERRASHDSVQSEVQAEMSSFRKRMLMGRTIAGDHHMSVLVHVAVDPANVDDTLDRLDLATGHVGECFKAWGVPPIIETVGMERAVWSQVPGASKRHNGRVGKVEALNFASFASLHSFPKGKMSGNLWGDCLLLLETEGRTGYALNFHEERPGMVPGHVNICALTGRGKTLLMAILVSQADKVEPRVLWFDRENGATVFVEAMNGHEIVLSTETPLGNPCKMPDSVENRATLREMLMMMATCYGYTLTESDIGRIAKVVEDNFDDEKTPFADRKLSSHAWRFGLPDSGLYQAMAIWHSNGANAAVFDNDEDGVDLARYRHIRVEMRHLMKDNQARPELPVLAYYLTHRFEQSLDGTPAMVVWDEAQLLVRNRFWAAKIEAYRETFRRRNCVTVFITPEPNALYNPVLAVKNQAVVSIYLGNDKASTTDYVANLDCTESERQYIRSMPDFWMLIKRAGGASVHASFDMSDMPDLIPVLSSNDKSVTVMREVKKELGTSDPETWVPVFMKRATAAGTHNQGPKK
ncbi:cagE, TrbE, VirB, component of type IV transporter system family protein (plasmid) [Burkholderia gladioli]|uniref:CagE, TrbE, VirB, component of type IV transporter system family protein n=1 Tax=Burkholderia gladioli TaxID=28095 RepID=A0AAW3FA80_BURGA|nr:hypothetical protein [Burkholderia gladioli]AJW93655.1 cagE, TrbE, VirB, component of type IV transporter system family protein [Burkholderia gladioli]AWY53038.1 hypothetical protein A8H28_17225 [Burkholderia gladioli pv. gladioli]KGC24046.1 cagE, TrbE, VirB, component of type IV transporter system family protein [Burkholderia gladioli]